jgi:hypothetical protein
MVHRNRVPKKAKRRIAATVEGMALGAARILAGQAEAGIQEKNEQDVTGAHGQAGC